MNGGSGDKARWLRLAGLLFAGMVLAIASSGSAAAWVRFGARYYPRPPVRRIVIYPVPPPFYCPPAPPPYAFYRRPPIGYGPPPVHHPAVYRRPLYHKTVPHRVIRRVVRHVRHPAHPVFRHVARYPVRRFAPHPVRRFARYRGPRFAPYPAPFFIRYRVLPPRFVRFVPHPICGCGCCR